MISEVKEPVIIIAAARSGTKMLRYVLSASIEFAGYPYDANYVWKYGNYDNKFDEIEPDSLDEKQKDKIRAFFQKILDKESKPRLLEKSVSNSLRIPFVRSIFHNCKIIHLYRNGYDVAASSRLCWQASARSERIQSKEDRHRKALEFPISMAWPYLIEYAKCYFKRFLLMQEHVDSWGPRYKGIDDDVKSKPLIEVCALQWAKCVEHCSNELNKMKKGEDYINVSYDSLVAQPAVELNRIIDFLGVKDGGKIINRGIATIKKDSVGESEKRLSPEEQQMIHDIVVKHQSLINNLLK